MQSRNNFEYCRTILKNGPCYYYVRYITDKKTANGVLCEVARAIYRDRIYLKSKVS